MDTDETLVSHLEALRATLIKSLTVMALVLPFMFFISPTALEHLTKIIIGKNNIVLNYFSPMEVFILQIKLSLLMDFLVCFPFIAKKFWDFVYPALFPHEAKIIKILVFLSSILFLFGVSFCIFMIIPLIINFGMSFAGSNFQAVFGITNVVNLALGLSFVFGLMFQIPLIINILIRHGAISYESVSSKRPYLIVGLLFVSAFLTPPDVVSQVLLFCPTYILFEIGLLFSKNTKKED